MANLNSSTFLANVKCKIVQPFKNSDFHSNFNYSTVATNFLKNLVLMAGKDLECTVVPKIWYGQSKSINILAKVKCKHVQLFKTSDFHSDFRYSTVATNFFEI